MPSSKHEKTVEGGNVATTASDEGVATLPVEQPQADTTKAIVDGFWEWAGRLVEAKTEEEALSMLDALWGKDRAPYGVQPATRYPERDEPVVHWKVGEVIGVTASESANAKQVRYSLR